MSRIEGLKGTRDFYPAEMRLRRWLESRWREVAERFAFEEYDGPVIEPLELYVRKSGEEIVGQLYAFEDKGGRKVALRPEMTPSLARMIAARSQGLPKPIKWYSIPRLFRYERPQRGRLREFFQLNLDIVGVEGIEADAEIIAAGVEVLKACGLTESDFEVRYSDRRLLDAALAALSIPDEAREAVYAALDKLLKADAGVVVAELEKAGVPRATAETLTRAVARRDLAGLTEELGPAGDALAAEAERMVQLERCLEAYGVAPFCAFDAAIVRGLAYYTGVVFEMYDRAGELRAICGGGRFDGLVAAAGGEDLPAVGFGLGDAVLLELLDSRGRVPELAAACDAYVIPVAPGDRPAAMEAVTRIRAAGLAADLALKDQSVGKLLKRADQSGARVAVLIGEKEMAEGTWRVKEMETGAETALPPEEAIRRLRPGGSLFEPADDSA
ncbi:MAG TPA: histidine--tRNA ligase [Gemmatimonadota bacterium]|nr:histidine--tRNA ligase [Gemmatimonadota bacterium]